jgi:signal peptidase II
MIFLKKLKDKKNLFINKENIFFYLLAGLIFTLDRISKLEIINNFNNQIYYVNEYINFDLIWNTGIGFGFLSSSSLLFYNLITVFIGLVILIIIFLAINSKLNDKLIFSIIIGGAIGNFYDRSVLNAVPDFIDIHYKSFHWFTFNIADIFITIGIIAFIIKELFVKKNK